MKKILLISMMAVYVSASAQKKDVTVGQHMEKFTSHFYTGTALGIAGGLFIGFSSSDSQKYIGLGMSTAGLILVLEAYSHIATAGRLLDSKLAVGFNNSGFGLSYTFYKKKPNRHRWLFR